jgi:type IV pilus assembly protein PilV
MKTNTGFTLIEVLIAMLILAIGLLGLAGLQTSNIRSNLAAYNHGQAVQLLYDIADRMRANNCNPTSTITCNIPPYANADAAYEIANTNKLGSTVSAACMPTPTQLLPTGRGTPTSCTPTILAGDDLIQWNNAISATLPMGRGCITRANGIFTLYITWDDDRSGTIISDVAVPTGCANTFATYVAPSSTYTSYDPMFSMAVQL